MENNSNISFYNHEDRSSKNVKANLGATALELHQFLTQDDEETKAAVKEAEDYHNLVDQKFGHVTNPDTPEYFVDWQAECFEKIKHEKNVILSAPTGSGKTQVFMEWAKEKQKEAEKEGIKSTTYITAPIKALSNQRFRELQEQGYKVGLETGDVKKVPDDADFICCTQEIFTNKYCKDSNATLIVDELHYMFENPDRQRAYIDGLHNAQSKNILTCSATMGDLSKTTKYINKVSGRDFASYETNERLTDLTYEGKIKPEEIKDAFVVAFSVNKILGINKQIYNLRKDAREDFLASLSDSEKKEAQKKYSENEAEIERIAKKYQVRPQIGMEYGIANYYGRMLPKEKLCVEELFEKGLIDTVVGTDALAMGVNFPIENVVFTQLMKYQGKLSDSKRLSKNLFDQLCGRAGRKGYFDHGHIYYATDFHDINGYPTEERYKKLIDEDDDEYGRWEWATYDTDKIFNELMHSENEDISVRLKCDMRALLSGKKSIEDEANYIVKFSTQYGESDLEGIRLRLREDLRWIQNYSIDEDFPEYDKEFHEDIGKVYDETIPTNATNDGYFDPVVEKNCRLFGQIVQDKHGGDLDKQKLSTDHLFQIYAEHPDNFNELLQFRKYIHSLPSKYRKMYDLVGLDATINSIDPTVLNVWSGQLENSDINIIESTTPDIELLMSLHDFEEIKDEIFEAIEKGSISAEKVFNHLDSKKQWEQFDIFKNELGCNIDITSVVKRMYDDAWDEYDDKYGRRDSRDALYSVDDIVNDNLIKIFTYGGNLRAIELSYGCTSFDSWTYAIARLQKGHHDYSYSYGDYYDYDDDDDDDYDDDYDDESEEDELPEDVKITIDDIVKLASTHDFAKNFPIIIKKYPEVSKKYITKKFKGTLNEISLAKIVYDDATWDYMTNELKIDKNLICSRAELAEEEDIPRLVGVLLSKNMAKDEILDIINSDNWGWRGAKEELCYVEPLFSTMVGLGFPVEKLYEKFVKESVIGGYSRASDIHLNSNSVGTLMGCGVPAQRIINDIGEFDFMLAHSDCLKAGGGEISRDKFLELFQKKCDPYLPFESLEMGLARCKEFGVSPSDIANIVNSLSLEGKIRATPILKQYGITVDINDEIKKLNPYNLSKLGIKFLLDHGVTAESIKGVVNDDERYDVYGHSKTTGQEWKKMVDEINDKRKAVA